MIAVDAERNSFVIVVVERVFGSCNTFSGILILYLFCSCYDCDFFLLYQINSIHRRVKKFERRKTFVTMDGDYKSAPVSKSTNFMTNSKMTGFNVEACPLTSFENVSLGRWYNNHLNIKQTNLIIMSKQSISWNSYKILESCCFFDHEINTPKRGGELKKLVWFVVKYQTNFSTTWRWSLSSS